MEEMEEVVVVVVDQHCFIRDDCADFKYGIYILL
jgi:hypothetical protein